MKSSVPDAEVRQLLRLVTIGRWRRVPGTRFPVSAVIVGVPGLSGVASKMSTRCLPGSPELPRRTEAYDGR